MRTSPVFGWCDSLLLSGLGRCGRGGRHRCAAILVMVLLAPLSHLFAVLPAPFPERFDLRAIELAIMVGVEFREDPFLQLRMLVEELIDVVFPLSTACVLASTRRWGGSCALGTGRERNGDHAK